MKSPVGIAYGTFFVNNKSFFLLSVKHKNVYLSNVK